MSVENPTLTTPDARRWFAMIPMLLGVLIGAVAISSATTALPAMINELRLSPVEAAWVIDSYLLALAVSLVIAARAGDQMGRRRIMVVGLLGFAVFNLLGGFATSGTALIAVRVLLGLSEAMVIASVVATIGVQFRARERVLAYGLWTATFGAGSAFGPLIGGLLADGPGWRWILFGAAPVAGIAALLAAWLVPNSRTAVTPSWDAASIALSVVAIAGLVYGLQHASLQPAASAVAGLVGVLTLVLFVRRQRRLEDPLVDVRLFQNRRFSIAYLQILIAAGTSSATVYLVSLHLQQSRGDTAVEAGMTLLPHAVMIVAGGVLAPLALRRLSSSTVIAAALLAQAAGLAWIGASPGSFFMPLMLVGVGMGMSGTLAATALFDVTTPEQAGQVGAIQEVAFALGAGLGIALFGGIALALAHTGFLTAFVVAAVFAAAAGLLPALWRPHPAPNRRLAAGPSDPPSGACPPASQKEWCARQ